MIKYLLFFNFVFSLSAHAENDIQTFKANLKYTNNLKFSENFVLEKKDGFIYLNKIKLESKKLITNVDSIQYIAYSRDLPILKLKCNAGKYTFTLTKDKEKKNEKGCLEDPRFEKLVTAFKTFLKKP